MEKILPDADGFIHVPEKPGLGVTVNRGALQKYLVQAEIRVGGDLIYSTPEL
jgi:L-alanine-DL-glutamate epimerase-like enolase superfamily enzyme